HGELQDVLRLRFAQPDPALRLLPRHPRSEPEWIAVSAVLDQPADDCQLAVAIDRIPDALPRDGSAGIAVDDHVLLALSHRQRDDGLRLHRLVEVLPQLLTRE